MKTTELHRVIVVGLVRNMAGELLLCKMKPDRGVFPGQWGLPGGGIEPGERMGDALVREMKEEIGVTVANPKPLFFKDGCYEKLLPDGKKQTVYMIFLVFHCEAVGENICLNEEFTAYRWIDEADIASLGLDLNNETIATLQWLGN